MIKILYALFAAVILMASGFNLAAQDARFSQYYAAPQRLNPSLVGIFDGTVRLGANYRDQYGSVMSRKFAYRTVNAGAEARFMGLKSDFVGVGLNIMSDRAGSVGYRQTEAHIGASYMKLLGRQRRAWDKSSSYLVAGVQAGFGQRGIDWTQAQFSTQFDGSEFDPTLSNGEPGELLNMRTYLDANAGLMYYNVFSERRSVFVGAALHHINSPNISLVGGKNERLYMKWTANVGGEFQFDPSSPVSWLPGLVISGQATQREANAGLSMRYADRRWEEIAFRLGAWMRHSKNVAAGGGNLDALILMTALEFQGFQLGLSYDFTLSGLREANNGRGAFEASLIYVNADNRSRRQGCPKF